MLNEAILPQPLQCSFLHRAMLLFKTCYRETSKYRFRDTDTFLRSKYLQMQIKQVDYGALEMLKLPNT